MAPVPHSAGDQFGAEGMTAWSAEEHALFLRIYPHKRAVDVAREIGRSVSAIQNRAFSFGLKKSPEFMVSEASGRLRNGMGAAYRFKRGQEPWNKNKSGVNGFSATRFKAGNKPQTWKPVGTEKIDDDGILVRKVADTRNRKTDWRPVHVLIWESANGPTPRGKVVIFADGNRKNFALSNLHCLTRAELMERNTVHRYPRELKHLMRLNKKLKRAIGERNEKYGR